MNRDLPFFVALPLVAGTSEQIKAKFSYRLRNKLRVKCSHEEMFPSCGLEGNPFEKT